MRISPDYLRYVVDELASFGSHPLGFRVAGTPEERAATAFIASEMRDAGLRDVVEEPVPVDAWRLEDAYVELADGTRFECASFGGVPETGANGVRGELARYADRIAVMYLSRIVEIGTSTDVIENPQHPYTKALLSVVPQRDPRQRTQPQILRGEAPDATRVPSGCRFHPRCPIAIDECRSLDPELSRPRESVSAGHRAACILA